MIRARSTQRDEGSKGQRIGKAVAGSIQLSTFDPSYLCVEKVQFMPVSRIVMLHERAIERPVLLRLLIRSRLDLLDHFPPVATHPGRTLQTVQNVRTIGALKVERGCNHFFLIIARFGQRNARWFTDERRAARSLFSVRR